MTAADGREVYLQIPTGGSLLVAAANAPAREPFESYSGRRGARCPSPGPGRYASPRAGPRCRRVDRSRGSCRGPRSAKTPLISQAQRATAATFARPSNGKGPWRLDLGQVRDSARVHLNGRELATLIGPSYQIVLDDAQMQAKNVLAVSVSNLAANRIRDLDRRGVAWKKFYNVNFPARLPENRGPDGLFTAAGWEPARLRPPWPGDAHAAQRDSLVAAWPVAGRPPQPQTTGARSEPQHVGLTSSPQHDDNSTESQHAGASAAFRVD